MEEFYMIYANLSIGVFTIECLEFTNLWDLYMAISTGYVWGRVVWERVLESLG